MINETISHYKITDKLGEGGMGVVYRAHDTKLKRDVAIKFLPKHLSSEDQERERFFQEAQAASALNHPNICVIHGIDEEDGETYIVMELVEGTTLRSWMKENAKRTIHDRVGIAIQIAEGLEAAHEQGIIHRDVKAESVMVLKDSRAKVMDFGLAKVRGVSKLTKTGSTVGTMAYMSPEQVEGQETDHRTDIFSFGVVLYELLAGKLPFEAEHQSYILIDPFKGEQAENRIMKKITSGAGIESYPTWSPDGQFIAYETDDRGNLDIVVQPLAGGELIRVVGDDSDDAQPAWSPDGWRLAFVSARDHGGRLSISLGIGSIQDFNMSKGADIFIVPAFGGSAIKLVENGAYPSWSPDGSRIVFQSDRGDQYDLWTVSADGGTPIQLTNDVDYDYHPAWSPDGKWIVFGTGRVPVFELGVISASGEDRRVLTNDDNQVVFPAWDSDGKSILFSSGAHGPYNLWRIAFSPGSASWEQPHQITLGEGNDVAVSVARSGRKVAMTIGRVDLDIWELNVTSGGRRKVTTETSWEDLPWLSPDGTTLIISTNRDGTKIFYSISRKTGDIYTLENY